MKHGIVRRAEIRLPVTNQVETRLSLALRQVDALTSLPLNRATGENRMGTLVAEPTAI